MTKIQAELQKTESWLESNYRAGEFLDTTDYGEFSGQPYIHIPESEEETQKRKHRELLVELLHLKEPINYVHSDNDGSGFPESPWGLPMSFGVCPCPGVPRYLWDEELQQSLDDEMREFYGENR